MVQDGIFTVNVYRDHEKPWVEQLMVPYLVFFGVACMVSSFTLGQKGKLLVDKFRQRHAAASNAVESVETLEEKLIASKMEIRKIYCLLLLGATEGARCDFRMFDAKTNRVYSAAPMFTNVPATGLCGLCFVRLLPCGLLGVSRCPSAVFTRWSLCCRSADVCTLALLPCSICRRVHPFGRCPSHAFE